MIVEGVGDRGASKYPPIILIKKKKTIYIYIQRGILTYPVPLCQVVRFFTFPIQRRSITRSVTIILIVFTRSPIARSS